MGTTSPANTQDKPLPQAVYAVWQILLLRTPPGSRMLQVDLSRWPPTRHAADGAVKEASARGRAAVVVVQRSPPSTPPINIAF